MPVYDAPVLIDRTARKRFSQIGWIMLMVIAVLYSVSLMLGLLLRRFHLEEHTLLVSALDFFPIYLTGFPLALFFFSMMDGVMIPQRRIAPARLLQIFLICLPIMYGGNIIGIVLSLFLSNGTAESPVLEVLSEMTWLDYIAVVIVAPIVEEVLCRKMIIDHTLRYGERTAIVFSALCFGLLHRNFFQFFYAFGLGLVFGYVYVRSGRLRYTIGYHISINFLGGVLGPLLLRLLHYEELLEVTESGSLQRLEEFYAANGLGLAAVFLYGVALLGGCFAGVVLLILRWREIRFYHMPEQLARGTVFCTVCLNIGMVCLVGVCVLLMVLSLMG